jgi:hypothetical protein
VLVKDDITLSGPGLMRVLARTEVHGKIEKDGRGSAHLSEMSETGARAARAGRAAGNPDEKILPDSASFCQARHDGSREAGRT